MAQSSSHVVPHHFSSAKQAFESAKLGTWLFLVTEVLLFGGLFVAYIVYRALYPEAYHAAAEKLDWKLGAINTAVLLISSLTMALAVNAVKFNQIDKAKKLLLFTLACGLAFMVIKYNEYSHKFHDGLLTAGYWGENLEAIRAQVASKFGEGITTEYIAIFFSIYFMMTGLHGIHVVVGMGLIFWVYRKCGKGQISAEYNTPVEMVGIYWHLVDLIWIYLFPLFYLMK